MDGCVVVDGSPLRGDEPLEPGRGLLDVAASMARLGGWYVDLRAGRVVLSAQACELCGVPAGTTMALAAFLRFPVAEHRERIRTLFERCAHAGEPYDEELEIATVSDDRLWVRSLGQPVRDGAGEIVAVRGALQEITTQKRAAEFARRLSRTLENITDAFFMLDADWRFTYLNRHAEHILRGEEDVRLIGQVVWEAFPRTKGSVLEREYRRAMRERRAVHLEEFYPPLGAWFEIHAYPSEEGLAVYFRDITEQRHARQEVEFLALYDPLTRLPNRRLLLDRLQQAIAARQRGGGQIAVLFLDLDHFKNLNDTLGHVYGDHLLRQVAQRLQPYVRGEDTVARFGGDEFAIILRDLAGDEVAAIRQAERTSGKILATLNEPYQLDEYERHLTVSIGITLVDGSDDTADDLLKRVDLAMYQAKEAGRGTLRLFDPAMRAAVHYLVDLEADLRTALSSGAITPYYQAQVAADAGVVGIEALARWQHPQRGAVWPAEFIPVAEQSGLILPLGEAMLEAVCRQLAVWAGRPALADLVASVNVSPRQFHHPTFHERVCATIERTGAPPARLCLEITEGLLLVDVGDTVAKMERLRALGVQFSLDDFGTGYSSLAYLKRLPLNQLKIDQGFVKDALTDANDAAIVRTVIALAGAMGLEVIAEGVENEALRAMLADQGCRKWQGYLFGHPQPPAEFEAFLRRFD